MDTSAPWPRYDVAPYRAEGGFTPGGSALLLIASLAAGLVLGAVAGFVQRWFYFVLVFPLFIGAGVGGAGFWAVKTGKVRSVFLGGVSGLLGGVFAMLAVHYVNYLHFENSLSNIPGLREARSELRKLLVFTPQELDKRKDLPPELVAELQDPDSRANLAVQELFSFIDYRAVLGVQISGTRRAAAGGRGGLNLGYVGSYIYWLVEVLIVAGIALGLQVQAARTPFCSQCQNWKETKPLGMITKEEVAALESGDLEKLRTPPAPGNQPMVLVSASVCPVCEAGSDVDVEIGEITGVNNDKPVTHRLAHVTYPGEALPYLQTIFQQPPPEPPSPPELPSDPSAPPVS